MFEHRMPFLLAGEPALRDLAPGRAAREGPPLRRSQRDFHLVHAAASSAMGNSTAAWNGKILSMEIAT
jgi:hypothetical protein